MASGSGDGRIPDLPRGLIDRRGAPAGKARLTSLRSPRDLTLGGIPKRVFVPNIPVRKEKSAAVDSAQAEVKKRDNKTRDKSARGRGRGHDGRGRGRGRGESNLVQIQSVFEQGPSVQRVKNQETSSVTGGGWGGRGWGGGGRGGGSGGGAGGGGQAKAFKPDYSLDSDAKKKEIIDLLMRDDFLADKPEQDANSSPVFLPEMESLSVKAEPKKEKWEQLESSTIIKEEPEEYMEASSFEGQTLESSNSHLFPECSSEDLTCAQILAQASKSGKEELMLVQLPAMLPGFPSLTEEERAAEGTKKDQKNDKEEEEVQKPSQSSLRCFSEGYLGKLHVHKSGKVELVLGDQVLEVSMSVQKTHLQEVVSVRTDEGDKRMTMLGHVKHKMVVTPNFDFLLDAISAEDT